MIWQIATATGWSMRDIMWKINYPALRMMLADAPHYEKQESGTQDRKTGNRKTGGRKGKDAVGFFQSMLKNKDR